MKLSQSIGLIWVNVKFSIGIFNKQIIRNKFNNKYTNNKFSNKFSNKFNNKNNALLFIK